MTNDLTSSPEYQSTMQRLEALRQTMDSGEPYWHARNVAQVLGYQDWRNFLGVIERARQACEQNGVNSENHFGEFTRLMEVGSGAEVQVQDFYLSRLACYLAAMNGQPSKPEVAAAQAYFVVQTRRMELADDESSSEGVPGSEDARRVLARDEMKAHNKKLAGAAKSCGVNTPVEYAVFQNFGYKGLYAGLDMRGIQRKKKLATNQDILDHMPSAELAANLFRATQTAERLERMRANGPVGRDAANRTHHDIGLRVRQTIKDIGGTMPEDYAAVEHVKEARKRLKAEEKAQQKLNAPAKPKRPKKT